MEGAPAAFDLDRFVSAQDAVLPAVLRELREGRKRTHWMWFVFPQLAGLGSSATARHYAIASAAEARAYLAHPVLAPRLEECTRLVLAIPGRTALEVFGTPDDHKFQSCMTLFATVQPTVQPTPYKGALTRYFEGLPDLATLRLLGRH